MIESDPQERRERYGSIKELVGGPRAAETATGIRSSVEDKAMRFNAGKLKWSLVHFKSLEPLVKVLMFGAEKYSPDNWKKGLDPKEIMESMMRHVTAIMDGEINDPESGLPHIGHIMCNSMFYSYFADKKRKEQVDEVFWD